MSANVVHAWIPFDPAEWRARWVEHGHDPARWDSDFDEGLALGWHRQAADGSWWYRNATVPARRVG